MFIHLLRHGIAENPTGGLRDQDRALTEEGWKKLRRAQPTWRRLCAVPDVVLVSPLRRAQETAGVFAEAVRYRGELRTEPALVPEAPPQAALHLLEAEQLQGKGTVAVVGHEPHLGYLLGLLLTGNPRAPIPLKKGMLVTVETPSMASLIAELRWSLTQRAAGDLT